MTNNYKRNIVKVFSCNCGCKYLQCEYLDLFETEKKPFSLLEMTLKLIRKYGAAYNAGKFRHSVMFLMTMKFSVHKNFYNS